MSKCETDIMPRTCAVVLGLAVTFSLALVGTSSTAQHGAGSPAPNPHWSPDGCRYCHGQSGTSPQAIDLEKADAICWGCHDGVRGRREIHPVGRLFTSDQVSRPDGWPAPDGQVRCVTCHDLLQACNKGKRRPEVNSMFLREYTPAKPLAFCAKCHVVAAEVESHYSPHVMLDDKGRAVSQSCRFCHTTDVPRAKNTRRTGRPNLRTDELTLCAGCHRRHIDWFEPGHIRHPVSNDMIQVMIQAEDSWARLPGSDINTAATRPADAKPYRLPLGPGRRIECSTCHNPHQRGLFETNTPLGAGGIRPESEHERPQLRGLGKELCRACHRM